MCRYIVVALYSLCLSHTLIAQTSLSLNDYGFKNAKNGAQRARVLYDAQRDAIERGVSVDYSGIKLIELEITKDFKSIPLTGKDDFKGVEFVVKNNAKNVALFNLTNKSTPIYVDKQLLDGRNFRSIPELRHGEHLLVIQDNNLWVDNRVGHNYGHTRKDILLIKDGISQNAVISPYDNLQSSPTCELIKVPSKTFQIGNFTMTRAADSKFKTFCINVQGVAHLQIVNIQINTPQNDLIGDRAICVLDCADVTLKNITINNTYSQSKKYGYGISINNAWNTCLVNVNGKAKWGLLGNNNLNNTYLTGCQLNRFDIHCYGRNVYMKDCHFDGGSKGWYCGGSSIYGKVQYTQCSFVNCFPFAIGNSYKTAVGVEVVFDDCIFNATPKVHSIFRTKVFNKNINPRKGLSVKSLPNITINNMTVKVPRDVTEIMLYDVGNVVYPGNIGYIDNVKINGLTINCEESEKSINFRFINTPVKTDKPITIAVSNLAASNANVVPIISNNHQNHLKLIKSVYRSVESLQDVRKNNGLQLLNKLFE